MIGSLIKQLGTCKSTGEVIGVFKEIMQSDEVLNEVSSITGMKINGEDIRKVIENSEFEERVSNLVSEGTNLFSSTKEKLAVTVEEHEPVIEE